MNTEEPEEHRPLPVSQIGSLLACVVVATIVILALTGLVLSIKALVWAIS